MSKYHAFISYSRKDSIEGKDWSNWIFNIIEQYVIPEKFVGRETERYHSTPLKLSPVFKDTEELNPGGQLTVELQQNLRNSNSLVVLCSPSAAAPNSWTDKEIIYFKENASDKLIIPIIIAGEPYLNNSEEGCYPESLRLDDNTLPDGSVNDVLGIDLRIQVNGKMEAGWTSMNLFKSYLTKDKGLSYEEAYSLADRYEIELEKAKVKIISALLGVSYRELSESNIKLQAEKSSREFRDTIVEENQSNPKATSLPSSSEDWEIYSKISTYKRTKNFPSGFEGLIMKAFADSRYYPPAEIKDVYWCYDSLYALNQYDDSKQIRQPEAVKVKEGNLFFTNPVIQEASHRNVYMSKPDDDDEIGWIRNFIPFKLREWDLDIPDFLISTTRSFTYWSNSSLYVFELCVDGELKAYSSYHARPYELWSQFAKNESDTWRGDNVHDVGQKFAVSPDRTKAALVYGALIRGSAAWENRRIEVWTLHHLGNMKRIFSLQSPFGLSNNVDFLWSPSSNFIAYKRHGNSDVYLINVMKQQITEIISTVYGGVFGQIIWHPTKDILILGLRESRLQKYDIISLAFYDPLKDAIVHKQPSNHRQAISFIGISPNGQYIASSGHDMSLILWDVLNNSTYYLEALGESLVNHIEFSPDGNRLVTQGGSTSKTITIWDVVHRRKLAEFEGNFSPISGSVWNEDGRMIVYSRDKHNLEVRKISI